MHFPCSTTYLPPPVHCQTLGSNTPRHHKARHPTIPPPSFWDRLSNIPLTRSALQELDRRNSEDLLSARPVNSPLSRQVITRRVAHEWKLARKSIQPASQYLSQCSPTELKRIQRFSREGGPTLSDLRGYNDDSSIILQGGVSSGKSWRGRRKHRSVALLETATSATSKTKNTGPYDRAFEQHLIDHGVYPDGYRYPGGRALPKPDNLGDIRKELSRSRRSLSPSRFTDEDFEMFRTTAIRAHKEEGVFEHVMPIIEGRVDDVGCVNGKIPFGNLDHLTDKTLVAGSPDRYYGARPEQLVREVRAKLNGYIVPSTDDSPVAPNFFFHAKGPDGSTAVVGRQICYDGALGARGIHKLQAYGKDDSGLDNKAYTLALSYYNGVLEMHTSHIIPPACGMKEGNEYATTHVGGYLLTNSAESFRAGVGAYRNARDWAEEQRNEAIKQANERFAQVGLGSSVHTDEENSDIHADDHTKPSSIDYGNSENEPETDTRRTKRVKQH